MSGDRIVYSDVVLNSIVVSAVTSFLGPQFIPLPSSLVGLLIYSAVTDFVVSVVASLLKLPPIATPFQREGLPAFLIGLGISVLMLMRQGATITLF